MATVDPFAYKTNHGRRTITIEERIEAIKRIDQIKPKNEREARDVIILNYWLRDNLSAQAIARKQDNRIVSFSNRSNGLPLKAPCIARIIADYFPEFKNRTNRGDDCKYRARIDLRQKRKINSNPHIKRCAFCGSENTLEEHHMIPLFLGGNNDDENLIFLCREHHKQVSSWAYRHFSSNE